MAKAARERGAVAGGRAALDDVRRRLAGGWPAGLTVLTGDDLYHLDRAQAALLESLAPESAGPYGVNVFAGPERVELGRVVAAARSAGLFADRRVVLVRDVEMLDGDPEPLQEFAESPPENAYLLIRAPALDQRRRIHKALAGCGTVLRFVRPEHDLAGESLREIRALAADRGLRLDRESAQFLAEAVRGDLYRAQAEIDKLRDWAGAEAGAEIRLPDVRELVAAGDELSGWEIAEAVLDRDPRAGVQAVRRLLIAGAEPVALLGGLAWRVRGLVRAKAMLDAGAAPREAVSAARAWRDGERFLSGLARYRMKELIHMPYLLAEADRALKSRAIEPGAVLERLVLRLTVATSPETA